MLLVLGCAMFLPGIGKAQIVTGNAFVSVQVQGNNGLLTIWQGQPPPIGDNGLTYPGFSIMTVEVNGVYYTYNTNLGSGSTPPAVDLGAPQATKIQDTVQCLWKEAGFDIVQDVYPVAFKNSGVIVIKIKIINHGPNDLPVQAQFLLDNENSTPSTANDNPDIITNNGYLTNTKNNPIWYEYPQQGSIPSFDLTFENHPSSANLLTVGAGYFDDTYTPSPLGLIPPSLVQFGYYPDMEAVTWGPAAPNSGDFGDDATLMMGPPSDASSALSGDSVTEIFRTAFGTPEWCMDHGKIVGVAMYPEHITWDPVAMTYSPNPFQVQTFLFTDDAGGMNAVTIRQTVTNPINITSPKPVGPQTTQLQNVGSIGANGVAIVNWMDSVLLLPSGCKQGVPIDVGINFDVKGVDSPIFIFPWGCAIDVDCAHPDLTPPKFHNSFVGCDSIFNDTIAAHDDTLYDLGLQNITYTSPDLKPAQYSVTIDPPPPYNCIDTSAKIFVQQLDTVNGGQVIFTLTDCAGNISMDTVCFTPHPPIPDLTAPMFWNDSATADCHAQCTEWNVTDTTKSATSIDRGVDSIKVIYKTNATVSGIPNGGKYPDSTLMATFHICVTDSLFNDTVIIRASDTSHNFRYDTIYYCTTADTNPPVITYQPFNSVDSSFHVSVTDSQAWDRGVDSVWIENGSNVVTDPPSPIASIGCKPFYDFRVVVVDTAQCASASLFAKDCAGHVSGPINISFTKGKIPVIVASKTTLCTTADSALLDAGTGYSAYLWSNGETSEKITVGAGVYFVTVQEGAGCPATSPNDTIALSPATTQITPAGPIALCAPDSVLLDGGAGFAAYQWLRDGTIMLDTTSEKVLVSSTGNYSVRVTNAAGCMGTSSAVSVTINPPPPPPTITALNTVLTSSPGVTYQWSQNGVLIPGATKQTDTVLVSGSYTVTITDANGCANTSAPFIIGASTVIYLPQTVLYKAESNSILIPLSDSAESLSSTTSRDFVVTIAFNKTLLIPNGAPANGSILSQTVKGDSLLVLYHGSSSQTNGVILNIPFTAALGDDSCTSITIDSFAWILPNGSVTTENGNFCLTNLCYQGGTRLIDPTGAVSLSKPVPNPSFNNIEIGYELIEQGHTTLTVYDILGHEVLHLVDADLTPGTYTVSADVSMLPSGTYVYSLRTPTIVKSDQLQISR